MLAQPLSDAVMAPLPGVASAAPHSDVPEKAEFPWAATVIVTLRDGRVTSRHIDRLTGRGSADTMSPNKLLGKFSDLEHPGPEVSEGGWPWGRGYHGTRV